MLSIGQFVTSEDGTRIWADHIGDPSKPAVVFIPGFSCTSLAFEKQWNDPALLKDLHLVRVVLRALFSTYLTMCRSDMMSEGRARVTNLSKRQLTPLFLKLKTSRLFATLLTLKSRL